MIREGEVQNNSEKIDVLDLIINCLREHETKFDQLLGRLEEKTDKEINSEELRHYGLILVEDKRGPGMSNYGQIVQSKYGVNGLELSTDKGYVIVFSDSEKDRKEARRL